MLVDGIWLRDFKISTKSDSQGGLNHQYSKGLVGYSENWLWMEDLVKGRCSKETRVISAHYPRKRDSVLVPGLDELQVVYDVFQFVRPAGSSVTVPVNFMFLHGSGMNRAIWEYYVANLLKEDKKTRRWHINKIVTVDQVTHGDSAVLNRDKLSVDFDWEDGARDACKVARKEFVPLKQKNLVDGIEPLNILVGHSMGGFQAMYSAVIEPLLFDMLITIEPVCVNKFVLSGDTNPMISINFYEALWAKMTDTFANEEEYTSFMEEKSFFTNVHPSILQRIKDFERIELADGSIRTKISQRQNILCYMTLTPAAVRLLRLLPSINIPVVSIIGGQSNWAPPENQETLSRLIPNYTKDIIDLGDHLVNIEIPDEVIMRIENNVDRFVDNLSAINHVNNIGWSSFERETKFSRVFERLKSQRITRPSSNIKSKL